MTGLYAESTGTGENADPLQSIDRLTHDAVIRCHSRNPSSGLVDHRLIFQRIRENLYLRIILFEILRGNASRRAREMCSSLHNAHSIIFVTVSGVGAPRECFFGSFSILSSFINKE